MLIKFNKKIQYALLDFFIFKVPLQVHCFQ